MTTQKNEEDSMSTLVICAAILLSAVLIAGAIYLAGNNISNSVSQVALMISTLEKSDNTQTGNTNTQPTQPTPPYHPTQPTQQTDAFSSARTLSIDLTSAPMIGNASAPGKFVEISDFQCPYCGRFYTQSWASIKTDYIDKNKFKAYFLHFPLGFHENAQKAAEASACAQDQGKFWEYKSKLFTNQNALSTDNLKAYAKDLGLDATKFDTCLDGGQKTTFVEKDMANSQTYGVQGTPSFIVTMPDTTKARQAITNMKTGLQSAGADAEIIKTSDGQVGVVFSGAMPYNYFKIVLDGAS